MEAVEGAGPASGVIDFERPVARKVVLPEFDFYRCVGESGCRRIITAPEMAEGMRTGAPCPCGGLRFAPSNLPWYGWFLPRVWKFGYLRLRREA